jgi:hypothetical protein
MTRSIRSIRLLRGLGAGLAAAGLLAVSALAVAAHPHVIGANGQVIANGQNHYGFVAQGDGTFLSCDTFTPLANVGNAWYGLETAHHGPDSGDAGRGDGCYLADSSPVGEADDVNPAID